VPDRKPENFPKAKAAKNGVNTMLIEMAGTRPTNI